MSPSLETLAVCCLALLGFLLGRWSSRLPKPYWLLGYFIPFFIVNYLVIFEVTERDVVVGDPIVGKSLLSHAEFMKKWRKSGIVLRRSTVAAKSG